MGCGGGPDVNCGLWRGPRQCKKSGFHDLNSQIKCSRYRQNKLSKCAHKPFSFFDFANGRRTHVMSANVTTVCKGAYFYTLKSRAG